MLFIASAIACLVVALLLLYFLGVFSITSADLERRLEWAIEKYNSSEMYQILNAQQTAYLKIRQVKFQTAFEISKYSSNFIQIFFNKGKGKVLD